MKTVALYLTTCADHGLKVATLNVRLAAISKAHVLAHHSNPTQEPEIREVLLPGIRRTCKTARVKKEPITLDVLLAMLQHIPPSLPGIRDRAILIVDFAGVFRRSELVALNVEDIRFQGNQMTIAIRRSKTDQEAQGMLKHFPLQDNADLCPLRAMRSWLEGAQLKAGPIFRPFNRWGELRSTRLTDRSIANLIKQYAQKVGLDPADYSGHSARRGGITAMLAGGAATFDVMDQSGQRRVEIFCEDNDEGEQNSQCAANRR